MLFSIFYQVNHSDIALYTEYPRSQNRISTQPSRRLGRGSAGDVLLMIAIGKIQFKIIKIIQNLDIGPKFWTNRQNIIDLTQNVWHGMNKNNQDLVVQARNTRYL